MTDRRALAAALSVAGIAAASVFADADLGAAPRGLPPPSFAAWSLWFAHVGPGAGFDALVRAAIGALPFPAHPTTALASLSALVFATLGIGRRLGPGAVWALLLLPAIHAAAALPGVALTALLFVFCQRPPSPPALGACATLQPAAPGPVLLRRAASVDKPAKYFQYSSVCLGRWLWLATNGSPARDGRTGPLGPMSRKLLGEDSPPAGDAPCTTAAGAALSAFVLGALSPAAAVALWPSAVPRVGRLAGVLGAALALGLDLLQLDLRPAPSGPWSDLADRLDPIVVFAERAPALVVVLGVAVATSGGSTLLRLAVALAVTALDLRLDGPLDLPLHDHLTAAGLGLDLLVVAELGAFFGGRVERTDFGPGERSGSTDSPAAARPQPRPQPRAVLIALALLAGAQSALVAERAASTWQKPALGLGVDPDPMWSFGLQMGARGFAFRADLCPAPGLDAQRCRRGLAAGLGWHAAGHSVSEGRSPHVDLERLGDRLATAHGDPELRREIYFGMGLRIAELREGFVQPLLPLCRRDSEVALDRRDWCEMGAALGSLRDTEAPVESLAWALPAIEEGGRPLYARALGTWAVLLGADASGLCWGRLPAQWSILCERGYTQLTREAATKVPSP